MMSTLPSARLFSDICRKEAHFFPIVGMQTFRVLFARLVLIVLLAAFFIAVPFHAAWAQTAPTMNTLQSVAVLGHSTVTNTGPTVINGDLDLYSGTSITGFPPGVVVLPGTTHTTDAVAQQAQVDNVAAYGQLSSQAPCSAANTFLPTDDLGGKTLVAGVYCFTSSAQLTGTLTLDGASNPSSVWVFIIESTLTTAAGAPGNPGSVVKLINQAQNCNVFWRVKSSATIGTFIPIL